MLELERSEDIDKIMLAFPDCKRIDNTKIQLKNDEKILFAILKYITEQTISILKIERLEPTLESLFLEVVKS